MDARIEEIVNRHTKTEETDTQKEETEEITEETNYKDVRKKGFIKLDKNLIRVLRT